MTAPDKKQYRRMLSNIRHGSQVIPDTAPGAQQTATGLEGATLLSAGPLLVAFLLFQRQFVQSFLRAGIR